MLRPYRHGMPFWEVGTSGSMTVSHKALRRCGSHLPLVRRWQPMLNDSGCLAITSRATTSPHAFLRGGARCGRSLRSAEHPSRLIRVVFRGKGRRPDAHDAPRRPVQGQFDAGGMVHGGLAHTFQHRRQSSSNAACFQTTAHSSRSSSLGRIAGDVVETVIVPAALP